MYRPAIVATLALSLAAGHLYAQDEPVEGPCCCRTCTQEPNELETVLGNLQAKAATLTSYQAKIDYVFRQPLLESQQRRTGILHYAKLDDRSYLRIDFLTLQQDDEKERPSVEQFLFDGVWLWHVDHRLKRVERRQMAEPNEPLDAFALASRQVPVLGFSQVEDLRRQFEVKLVTDPPEEGPSFHHLHLTVRPDSAYRNDYSAIDFWVDTKVGLPGRITAITTGEMEASLLDRYEIAMTDPTVNAQIDPTVFQIDIPSGFSVEVIPLEKGNRRK